MILQLVKWKKHDKAQKMNPIRPGVEFMLASYVRPWVPSPISEHKKMKANQEKLVLLAYLMPGTYNLSIQEAEA
jgi:hypothetical protein